MRFDTFLKGGLLLACLLVPIQADAGCRKKCGLPSNSNPTQDLTERSLNKLWNHHDDDPGESHGLNKRVLAQLGAGGLNVNNYVVSRVKALPNTKTIMFKTDRSTSRFVELGERSFDFGMEGLCGCTLLLVVSDTHVYGGHYFETLAFDNSDAENPVNTADFQGQVINFLDNGSNRRRFPFTVEGPALAPQAAHFPVGSTRAYVMAPADAGNLLYPALVNQLVAKVNALIGTPPIVMDYTPVDEAEDEIRRRNRQPRLLDSSRGRALYQYDVTAGVRTHRFIFEQTQVFAAQLP
ncbi:hypothetical protein BDV95DRAFT_612545 [Massariosphaeria phaeospora]|uniref:Uncharacterized protein n=1 Tax=Massariosphaeria phaeospora TaxID=100035 RepID=A0A7C8M1X9_9PLEO|nr:hypothetical protein BDV95DRAFT_612545 [Massariosphaeria phaeospora]